MTDQTAVNELDAKAHDAAAWAICRYDSNAGLYSGDYPNEHQRAEAAAAVKAADEVYKADQDEFVQRQVEEARLAGFHIDGDGADLRVVMARETAAGLVMAAKTFLDSHPSAKNYVEQSVWDRESGDRYVITFSKPGGKTPHELRQRAEMERDWLLAEAPDELRSRFFALQAADRREGVR